jgi:hypothetical protein
MGEVTEASTFHRQLPCIALCLLGFLIILGSLAATEIYSLVGHAIYLNLLGAILIVIGLVWGRLRSPRGSRKLRMRGRRSASED